MTTRRWRLLQSVVLVAVPLLLSSTRLNAHELAQASATLVVRDGGHVELRLEVPWSEILHQQLMPSATIQAYLARVTSQDVTTFARELVQAEHVVEHRTHIEGDGGTGVVFEDWRWPAPAAVREALRRELMSRLADGARFEHLSRLPATASVRLGRSPASVRLQLPAMLGPALLTVVQPREQWLAPGERSRALPIAPTRR